MNNHKLYRDVLTEGMGRDFEDALFRKTLATAKRVRRTRTALRTGSIAIIALASIFTFLRRPQPPALVKSTPELRAVETAHQTIKSAPFQNVIRSKPGPASELLAFSAISAISTADSIGTAAKLINDEELLGLLEGQAVIAFINRGQPDAEVIFIEGSDKY